MCSSGIRLGAWEYLKWKHIELIRRDEEIVAAKIIVYAGENEQYFSFITPEAFEALEEWMSFRRRSGEDINGESWVMRTLWDTTAANSSAIKSPKRMSTETIRQLVKRALKTQGLRRQIDMKVTRRYEYKALHGFRKFFQTNTEPKMKSLNVMILMGQDTGLAASYNKPTIEELLTEYLKAVDNLTFMEIRGAAEQYQEIMKNQQVLATKVQAKDLEINELRSKKDEEISELKEQMNKMGNVMRKLDSNMQFYRNEFMYYVMKFGHPILKGKDRKSVEELLAKVEAHA